jgi:hypothetical protein
MTDKTTEQSGAGELRERLGRRVREVWVEWAKRQPNPKPSWLLPYDALSEADKEADRCIGSAIWGDSVAEVQNAIASLSAQLASVGKEKRIWEQRCHEEERNATTFYQDLAAAKIQLEAVRKERDELSEQLDNATGNYLEMLKDCLQETARAEAAEQRARDMTWIPVSERLPENNDRVLVWHYDEVDMAQYWPWPDNKAGNRRGKWEQFDPSGYPFAISHVTHWMPLPEPPAIRSGE